MNPLCPVNLYRSTTQRQAEPPVTPLLENALTGWLHLFELDESGRMAWGLRAMRLGQNGLPPSPRRVL